MPTEPRTITALNDGQHVFEYEWPPVKDPSAEGRAKWAAAGGEIRQLRLGSIDDATARAQAPKRMSKDDREQLDREHPPRAVKVLGPEWEALWASQKPMLQAAVKAGHLQVTTGEVDDLEG